MGDLRFDKNGRLVKPTPLKWYETVLLSLGGIVTGLLICLILLDIGAIK